MDRSSELFDEIAALSTEKRNPRTTNIDSVDVIDIIRLISAEDHLVAPAVAAEIPYIAEAVELIVTALSNGGRLFYVGAGTSGRLGVVDASEIPPTFGTDPSLVQALIAGGKKAVFRSQEGAEDVAEDGKLDLQEANVTPADIVCGIAASRRTPYVVGAIEYARALGCKTLFVTCNPREHFDLDVDVAICANVGPEPIMGSTRMKSGTAQKFVLNMLTTASMIKLGKVYENMMIDLQMTSAKLVERSRRVVMLATGVPYEEADRVLNLTNGHVKTALVSILADVDIETAKDRLINSNGFVRAAILG